MAQFPDRTKIELVGANERKAEALVGQRPTFFNHNTWDGVSLEKHSRNKELLAGLETLGRGLAGRDF